MAKTKEKKACVKGMGHEIKVVEDENGFVLYQSDKDRGVFRSQRFGTLDGAVNEMHQTASELGLYPNGPR